MRWSSKDYWILSIWLTFLVGTSFEAIRDERKRAAQVRQFCADASWLYMGKSLPAALLRFQCAHRGFRLSNACEAVIRGVPAYIADFTFRRGKKSVRQTLFCFYGKAGNRLRSVLFSDSFHYEYLEIESWLYLYQDGIAVAPEDWCSTCESLLSLLS